MPPPRRERINLSPTVTLVLLALQASKAPTYLLLTEAGDLWQEGPAYTTLWGEAVYMSYTHGVYALNVRSGRLSRAVGMPNLKEGKASPQIEPVDACLHGPTLQKWEWAYDKILANPTTTWE